MQSGGKSVDSGNSEPTKDGQKRVAVVAMQGDYDKHIAMLRRLGVDAYPARVPDDIDTADGVVVPGGESTTIGKLLARYGVDEALRRAAEAGKPIYGTCAGMILLAREIAAGSERGGQPTLGLLDVAVARNAFGRQVDSFEADLSIPAIGDAPVHAVFIRAPIVLNAGNDVETLATYDGKTVFVRQGTILGSSFHPELTDDDRVHRYFVRMVNGGLRTEN